MKRSEERTDYLNGILTTALEDDAITYWGTVIDYNTTQHISKPGRPYHTYLWAEIELDAELMSALDQARIPRSKQTQSGVYKVNLETIARGLAHHRAGTSNIGYYADALLLSDQTNGNDGDFDVVHADCLIQLGLWGKVVFG